MAERATEERERQRRKEVSDEGIESVEKKLNYKQNGKRSVSL